MEITPFGPDDAEAVRHFVEVTNAARAEDSPWLPPQTESGAAGELRYGWDLEPPATFLAVHDGDVVGIAKYHTSTYDNQHLAWLGLEVHPRHRRRGHGSALLGFLLDHARADGRTCVGTDCWDVDGFRRFAERHGFAPKSVEVNRRQHPRELDLARLDRLHEEALAHAAAYDLVRWVGPAPEQDLAAMTVMVAAINDAPTDDLEIEDEVFTPERLRAFEVAHEGRKQVLHRVLARHRETGEMAGQTVVAVDGERPHLAEQYDTSVLAAHRGHRLGLLLKLDMLRWLREAQPQIETIDTWNAASNRFMIGVNEELGYRVVGQAIALQRAV